MITITGMRLCREMPARPVPGEFIPNTAYSKWYEGEWASSERVDGNRGAVGMLCEFRLDGCPTRDGQQYSGRAIVTKWHSGDGKSGGFVTTGPVTRLPVAESE